MHYACCPLMRFSTMQTSMSLLPKVSSLSNVSRRNVVECRWMWKLCSTSTVYCFCRGLHEAHVSAGDICTRLTLWNCIVILWGLYQFHNSCREQFVVVLAHRLAVLKKNRLRTVVCCCFILFFLSFLECLHD